MSSAGVRAAGRRLERRRLGGHADRVEHRDGARRGRRRAERLQLVLRGRRGQARRSPARPCPCARPTTWPDRGVRGLVGEQRLGQRRRPGTPSLASRSSSRCRPGGGRPPGDRAADVDEVPVAARARPEHRVREDDRVRLGPRDVLAEGGSHRQLVRRAGPRGPAAHRDVRVHQRPGVVGRSSRSSSHELGMEQVERGDVERRRHRDAGAALGEAHREVQPGPTVVQAAVDVRGRSRRGARARPSPRPCGRGCASRAEPRRRARRRAPHDRRRSREREPGTARILSRRTAGV